MQQISLTLFFIYLVFLAPVIIAGTIRYSSINELSDETLEIYGADNFVHLFVWKDLNISSIEDFMSRKQQFRIFSYNFDKSFTEKLFGQFIPSVYGNSSFKPNFVQLILREMNTECLQGSVFENFDALIDVSYDFVKRIRTARSHQQKRKHSNDYLNPNDFTIIPLFPRNVYLSNSTNLFDSMNEILQQNITITNLTCSDAIIHDWRIIEMLHGTLNVSTEQLKLANLIYSKNIRMNYTILNQLAVQTKSNQEIESMLWPSNCHFCMTQSCVAENWKWYDSVDMTGIVLGLFFYIALIGSGSFKLPIIRRRLGIPVIVPFLVMCILVSYLNAFNSGCVSLASVGNLYLTSSATLIYSFTVLRYYYLKNLYSFYRNSKRPKMHKVLSSTWFGIIVTVILPLFLTIFLEPAIIPFFPTYNIYTWNLTATAIIGVLVVIACILGIICFIIDIVINRKGIQEKGLRRFLFFEDPWFIRIDLSLISIVFILLIALIICYLFIPSSMAVFRLAISSIIYLICGGNAMIITAFQRIKTKLEMNRVNVGTVNDDFMELLISGKVNIQGYSLFKEYCEKELSLENIMLLEKLVSIKKREANFNFKNISDIYQDHLDDNSIYGVNVSHKIKNDFHNFYTNYKNQDVHSTEMSVTSLQHEQNWNVLNPLYLEVLENTRDTFTRFKNTTEFKEWMKIYAIQQDLHVV